MRYRPRPSPALFILTIRSPMALMPSTCSAGTRTQGSRRDVRRPYLRPPCASREGSGWPSSRAQAQLPWLQSESPNPWWWAWRRPGRRPFLPSWSGTPSASCHGGLVVPVEVGAHGEIDVRGIEFHVDLLVDQRLAVLVVVLSDLGHGHLDSCSWSLGG